LSGFQHEAWFYAGRDEFVAGAGAFISEAIEAAEPTLVVVSREKIGLLRDELRGELSGDGLVEFADMAEVGANPARIIPAWAKFVADHAGSRRRLRGIGEPVNAERSAAALCECHRHEALLNLAFADAPDFRLMCPYDRTELGPAVVAHARRTHPTVVDAGVEVLSADYKGLEQISAPFDEPLPMPPLQAGSLQFHTDTLSAVRRFVEATTQAAGLAKRATGDLVLAVNEVATNSLVHGGGRGELLGWQEPGSVVFEVQDAGHIDAPLAGRQVPDTDGEGGYGLWLANQVCDLVQVRTFADGNVVRLHLRVP
jgi:anti-sigma regulatory factor (Ser/Thr protein kinase)